jgi:hypothetical protein
MIAARSTGAITIAMRMRRRVVSLMPRIVPSDGGSW